MRSTAPSGLKRAIVRDARADHERRVGGDREPEEMREREHGEHVIVAHERGRRRSPGARSRSGCGA